jgi:N-acetylglutamate synthase-like GNAT family acetyltransferase
MLHVQIAALESIEDEYSAHELAALIKSKQYFHAFELHYYRPDLKISKDFDPLVTLIATYEDEIVGFAALDLSSISAVFVHPKYTRQKVATRLLLTLEQIAVDRSISSLTVVSSLNARSFYASCGYKELGKFCLQIKPTKVRVEINYMRKKLICQQPKRPFSFRRLLAKYIRLSICIVRSVWRSI